MTALIDARLLLLTPEKLVHFDICEHENGTRAQSTKFLLDGVLKQSIQLKIMVLSVVQEARCFVGRSNAVTENLLLIAGSSERFELYYGGNGKPRAYNVKMLVMTFSQCVVVFVALSDGGGVLDFMDRSMEIFQVTTSW